MHSTDRRQLGGSVRSAGDVGLEEGEGERRLDG